MKHYRAMDATLRAAWFALIIGGCIAGGELVRAQATDPIVRLGPEVWLVIAGGLVTVGINLEQLRRVRSDVKDLRTDGEKKHNENGHRLDRFDRRMGQVEETLSFLRRRRRSDRDMETFGPQNSEG